ncbi:MAG: SAM-dependent methyltransferase [Candidatus Acidulodesulfobacterium sp.]
MSGSENRQKTLFIVGVGPGDPELVTVKAINAVLKSDYIFYPDVCGGKNKTAYDIVKSAVKFAGLQNIEENRLIPLQVEMKRSTGKNKDLYRENALKIYEKLKNENVSYVSYVTLGDPVFYSTYFGINAALKEIVDENININIINGVSSFLYSFGLLEEPYIAKNASVLISVPLKKSLAELKAEIKFIADKSRLSRPQIIVFMKAGNCVKNILEAFEDVSGGGSGENKTGKVNLYLIEKSAIVKDFTKKADLDFDYFSILIGVFL